jgi:hypothetical protein
MKMFILKRRIRVLISIGLLFVFLSLGFNSSSVKAQDFTITSTSDFDNNLNNTTTDNNEYNVSTGELRTSFHYADKDSALEAYWRFEDDGANITDETGKRDSTNVYGATAFTTGDIYDSGYYVFDGTDDWIEMPSNLTLDDYTISLWVMDDNYSALQDPYFGMSKSGSPWHIIQIERTTSGDVVFIPKYTNLETDTFERSISECTDWCMLTMVVDGTDAKFYHNGVQSGATETVPDEIMFPDSGFRIGRGSPAWRTNNYYQGELTEFRILNRSLSDSEITTLYNEGLRYHRDYEYQKTNMTFAGSLSYMARPTAFYYGGLYLFGVTDTIDLKAQVRGYNDNTDTWSNVYDIGDVADTNRHRSAVFGILPDETIIAFYNNAFRYRISNNTVTDILADLTKLDEWSSETSRAGTYYYPQVITFSDEILVFFRRDGVANSCWWYDTSQDGSSWEGEQGVTDAPAGGHCYKLGFTKVGDNIFLSGSNESTTPSHFRYVYWAYTDDRGSTWYNANGTAIDSAGIGGTNGNISFYNSISTSYNTTAVSSIIDENEYPIILVTYCDDCGTGSTNVRIAQYDNTLGGSGNWNLTNATDQNGNVIITNDRSGDTSSIFLDVTEGRPAFYGNVQDGSNWYIKRFHRRASTTTTFDIKYSENTSENGYDSGVTTTPVATWDMPDRTFECMAGITDGGSHETTWIFGQKDSEVTWESDTITMTASYRLLNTTITHTISNTSSPINKIEFIESGTVTATYDTDIVSGTSTTITNSDVTSGSITNVDSDFSIKVYLTSEGANTAIITQIE